MRHLLPGLAVGTALLISPVAHAKDLRNRIGVGFNNQFGHASSLSVRYGLPWNKEAINLQLELLAGVDLDSDDTTTDAVSAGARVLYAIVAEDNMNLYAAAGLGWVSHDGEAGVRLQPGLSAQFFLFGLENLGFSADWGLSLDVGTNSAVASFTSAPGMGLHYYF
jgi:hypothetical protein